MDVAALEAALPAFTVSALTLMTASSQVYVGNRQKDAVNVAGEVWWQYLAKEPVAGGGLGLPMERVIYRAVISAPAATDTQLRALLKELSAAFHFRRAPTGLSDLDHARVLVAEMGPDLEELQAPAGAHAIADVAFYGDVARVDAGS